MDSDRTDDGILYADVPTRGVNTLYTEVGDMLGWGSVQGFLGLVLLSVVLSIRQRTEKTERLGPGMSVPIRPIDMGSSES
jgi:hypothetical protein